MLLQLLVAYLSVGLAMILVVIILEKDIRDDITEHGLIMTLIMICAFTTMWGPFAIWGLIK